MLIALHTQKDITLANDLLVNTLSKKSGKPYNIKHSTRGGSSDLTISYVKEFDFWWSNSKGDSQYWCPYGLGEPKENQTTTGRCQINYPLNGINRKVAALLAKDNAGKYYLLHSGAVGGGISGNGREGFLNFFQGDKQEVVVNNEVIEYCLIGCISATDFIENLKLFIQSVYDFKASNKTATKGTKTKKELDTDEYAGIKTYGLPARTVVASNKHALVFKALKEELIQLGLKPKRDRLRDLFTADKNTKKIELLFEIKSKPDRQSLYTAIGQLMMYGIIDKPKCFFVFPDKINTELIADLKKLNIETIRFREKNKKITFLDLSKISSE